jgi:hypothetical protein
MAEDSTTTEATENTAEVTESTATEQQESATDQQLGVAGKKALDAERREKRAAERRAAELEARLKEFEDRDKTEAQKLAERAEKAEAELATLQAASLRAEVALEKGLTPAQAKRLIGSTREELEADADELLEALGQQSAPRAPRPDPNQGRHSGGTASTADQFAAAVGAQFTT